MQFQTVVYSATLFLLSLKTQPVVPRDYLPLIINTWAFSEANSEAWDTLHKTDGNALDALVDGCSACERLQCDFTVGYGGSPNEIGETTLDAMIMDGATMNIGAVAGMRMIKDAARVARMVLERTQHTLLVGDGATDFAEAMGFRRESLTTPKSWKMWKAWRDNNCQPNFWMSVSPDPRKQCGPYKPLTTNSNTSCFSFENTYSVDEYDRGEHEFGRRNHDTIGMIVIDAQGRMYAGTSTNGARHKIPGRVGDSAIPGAGAYADQEIGAAVATGDGDVMMRFLPSFLAVEGLRAGRTPLDAAHAAMLRIVQYYPSFSGGLVVVNRQGNYSAACVGMKRFPFSVVQGDSAQRTRVEFVTCVH